MSHSIRTVPVAARPTHVELSPETTAVIVVDMQNDFATAGGMFDRAGIDIGCIQAIVPRTAEVLRLAHKVGMVVVYLKMGFRPDLSDTGGPTSPTWLKHVPLQAGATVTAPDGTASAVLIRDTWNTEIVAELTPEPDDIVLYKHRYSGFFDTELDNILRERGVTHLVVVGATTSVCVESTIRDAVFRDYHCLVLEDCVAEPIGFDSPRSNHEASLLVLELLFASITTSTDVAAALGPLVTADASQHAERDPMANVTRVERKSDREVVVTRHFDAPARLVFEAWSNPELFARWWLPKSMGMTLHSCEMDVRTGGSYRLGFGGGMDFFGRYLDVTAPSRIVWTNEESGDNGSITTVTLTETNGTTLLVVSELFPSAEALDADGGGAAEAMHETFGQLDELLIELASNP